MNIVRQEGRFRTSTAQIIPFRDDLFLIEWNSRHLHAASAVEHVPAQTRLQHVCRTEDPCAEDVPKPPASCPVHLQTLRAMLDRLSGLLWSEEPYRELNSPGCLMELIAFVSRSCEEQNAGNRTIFPNISAIISLLEKHSETDFTLEQLERTACTSPKNFTRQFRTVPPGSCLESG